MIVAGSGTRQLVHRESSPEYHVLLASVANLLKEGKGKFGGDLTVLSGGAEGFDFFLARAAFAAKVPFELWLPNTTYAQYYWGDKSLTGTDRMDEFQTMADNASKVVYCCDGLYADRGGKRWHANFARNIDMVDAADKMWVYDPSSKGTEHAYKYAQKTQKPVWLVPTL